MRGQELQARVTINYSQIQGTDASVFAMDQSAISKE